MQYNNESNHQDIVTMSEKLSKSNSVSFPIEEKTLYANQSLKMVLTWIHDAYGGWIYDDNNNTTFPEATTTLQVNQVDYALPVNNTEVQGVSVKTVGNVWYPLEAVTLEQINDTGISEAQFYNVSAQPKYYRLTAKSIKIYPAANYTQADSLKLYESRETSLFVPTDTTKEPGFDSQYHEAIPTFMALQYAKINQLSNKNDLQDDWDGNEKMTGRVGGFKKMIQGDYNKRFEDMFPPRMTVRDFTRDNQ